MIAPLLYDAAGLAAALTVSKKTLARMEACGKLGPRAITIGVGARAKRYSRSEVASWVNAGMPDREAWEAIYRQT
jgi:predicted DNA-binding transcriptional regulator AlpA